MRATSVLLSYSCLLALLLLTGPALALRGHHTSAQTRRLDPATKVEFTVTGGGHQAERVLLRDVYPAETPPGACYFHSGIMFGVDSPLLELRAGKLGPKLWNLRLLLLQGQGPLRVATVQPALIYNGNNSKQQQSWFAQIVLPPLRQGTLTATLLPGTAPGRVRGTFAGTLVDAQGQELTIGNGTFDLARRPDVE